jgi:hypothetical protein
VLTQRRAFCTLKRPEQPEEQDLKEATFNDALAIARQLDIHSSEVWRIIRGVRFTSLGDLSMLVHRALKESPGGGPSRDVSPEPQK